jgi:C-terminal peptidase prc
MINSVKGKPLPARPLAISTLFSCLFLLSSCAKPGGNDSDLSQLQQPYLDFIDTVYEHMDAEYYKPVSREVYENFIIGYKESHLSNKKTLSDGTGWLAHLGSGLLVQKLKDPEDTFTNFIPPREAEEYAKKVYGYEHGLGISGEMSGDVFVITGVETRSDAYAHGIRPGNAIMAINGVGVNTLSPEEINSLLFPQLGTEVDLIIAIIEDRRLLPFALECKEFFTETVEELPTGLPGVHYFKIYKFNRETANDLKGYLENYGPENIEYIVLDITGNPGGPPLAVREITALFLNPGSRLVYYVKKDQPEIGLISPPSDVLYRGRLMVLVDGKSGSSSETLAGVLQAHRRAIIMGKENTAGGASLKTAIRFEDGSMLALLTGQSFLFDGTLLGFDGVSPDYVIPEDVPDVRMFALGQIMLSMREENPDP